MCGDVSRIDAPQPETETTQIGRYAVLQKLSEPRKNLDVQYLEMHFGVSVPESLFLWGQADVRCLPQGHSDVGYSEVALHTMRDLIFDR